MKYVRKMTALVLAIIFCAAIIIGIGVIYSIKNVNVEYVQYSGQYSSEFEQTKQNLNKLKGSGLLFLKDGDVYDKVSDGKVIAVESYERIYPCTVNVRLKERVECFMTLSGETVSVYDEDGVFMRSVRVEGGVYLNALDSSPDVEVVSADGGVLTQEDYKSVANLCKEVKEAFGSLRKIVKSVAVYNSLNSATIKFRSGMSAIVSDWKNGVESKINYVYGEYLGLDDYQRTRKTITVGNGEIN